ncbi:MAG TPA: 4Fe-4S binding protein [Beijerinckiaceae bacterium]
MPLDETALARGCGGELRTADQLCRRQLDLFKTALATGAPITVGCTQEAPLFSEVAEAGAAERVRFANVRENAGWSADALQTGPKMAALLAAAAEPASAVQFVSMESRGIALVYGRDLTAIEAARKLADYLDVTVLLTKPEDIPPPRATAFPVLQGTIVGATGHLGAFSLKINDFAQPTPSSRERLVFGPARDGATSTCDLVLDLSGGLPLFPMHELRSGYLRADPRDPAAVERLVFEASHLVGTFDKPRFVTLHEGLCAHSRSKITGCTRCLELCPTGAIAPAGDHVAIDPYVCGGCGDCAAACPTGAVTYEVPDVRGLLRRLRTILQAYRAAGGSNPVLLLHDADHGESLIDALARFGAGLPANVIPVAVNEVTQVGPEAVAAAFAYGATGLALLTRGKPRHDLSGLQRTVATANAALAAFGYGAGLVSTIETDDPDALRAALDRAPAGTPAPVPASFLPEGTKRGLLELSFRELHRAAPGPVDGVALPAGAPFGGLAYDAEACTLCLACVGACPTAALSDNPEQPMLRFTESLCVQCGLCAATCPEDAIKGLVPRLDFPAWDEPRRVLKEEEPFHCVACAKPFGTKSAIEAVVQKLSDRHWMFSGAAGQDRVRVLMMCEDCRVEVVVNESFDPHGAPPRPRPRTTEDYLAERAKGTDGLN